MILNWSTSRLDNQATISQSLLMNSTVWQQKRQAACDWVGQPASQTAQSGSDILPSSGNCQSEVVGKVMSGEKKEKAYTYILYSLRLLLTRPSIYLPLLRTGNLTWMQDFCIIRAPDSQQHNSGKGKPWSSAPSTTSATQTDLTSLLRTHVTWWELNLYEYSHRPYSDVPQSTGCSVPSSQCTCHASLIRLVLPSASFFRPPLLFVYAPIPTRVDATVAHLCICLTWWTVNNLSTGITTVFSWPYMTFKVCWELSRHVMTGLASMFVWEGVTQKAWWTLNGDILLLLMEASR